MARAAAHRTPAQQSLTHASAPHAHAPKPHQAAPKTVDHIKRCAELGLYTSNHIFRVDKGFVAQVPRG